MARAVSPSGSKTFSKAHPSVRTDRSTGVSHWCCSYRKHSGGGITEPRRIYPLPLQDEGKVVSWHLLEGWKARLIQLPPVQSGNSAADGLGTYLKRQSAWKSLREELEARGERLVPYSFRHSYSLRAHRRNIDAGSAARSMGHSLEVLHLRSYPWASAANTEAAFQCAQDVLVATTTQPISS